MAVFPTHTHWSRGNWAACRECGWLIEMGQWEQLIERVVVAEGVTGAFERDVLEAMLRETYTRLRHHMRGVTWIG